MPSLSTLRKLFKRKSDKESQPPPYSAQERPQFSNNENGLAKNTYTYLRFHNITARSTPQWRWTNAECRAWIFEVLVKYLGHTNQAACQKAEKFVGFGPALWSLDREAWEQYLGEVEGQSVFRLLVSMCREFGTIPRGVAFRIFQRSIIDQQRRNAYRVSQI